MRRPCLKSLIALAVFTLAACAPAPAPTNEPNTTPPMEETAAETETPTTDTRDKTKTPAAMDETQNTTPLCDIDDSLLNHDLTTSGKIVFVDQNAEGAFAEVEQDGCKIGMFAPMAIYSGWSPEAQALYQQGSIIEAQGRLVSFDGQLILDLVEVRAAYAEPLDETAETKESSLPEAPESAMLEVPLVYSGAYNLPGLCYLGAAGILVKYEHPDLDFADIVALSGMGSSALHVDFPEMPSILISPYKEQGIVYMFQNLAAEFGLGIAKNGAASDTFQPLGLPFESHASTIYEFKNREEALMTLKQIVGSGKPVSVHLNLYHVYDDFILDSEYWRESIGKDHASHYMVVKGYDQDYFYLSDPTDPTAAAGTLKASVENFSAAWEDINAIPNSPPRGPFWMIYLESSGEIPDVNLVIEKNLKEAVNAPDAIRSFAERPDSSEFTRFLLLELGNARKLLGEYLARNGQSEAGESYLQSGNLLTTMALENNIQASLLIKAAEAEEIAIEILSALP